MHERTNEWVNERCNHEATQNSVMAVILAALADRRQAIIQILFAMHKTSYSLLHSFTIGICTQQIRKLVAAEQ